MGAVFDAAFRRFVDAFERRAERVLSDRRVQA
jgi:ribosome-associated toxin RatA of RatAB toxin-antitoxin module